MHLSYYAPALEVLWKLLKNNHVDPARVFSRYQLKYADLKETQHRIPLKTIPKLWDDASELIDSPCFGLDSYKYWHPGYMGALGYAWLSSATLREGFVRLSRFIGILSNSGQIILKENNTSFNIQFNPEELGTNLARTDNAMSIILHMCRINYPDTLNPSKVTFTHSKPDCAGEYFSYFKSNILFDASCDSISFPIEMVDKALPAGNQQLAKLNDQVMIQYLNELNKKGHNGLEEQIKAIIVKKLPSGIVTGQMVAEDLTMSYRSLQRKLTESGTSFKVLFEQSRHTLAEKYVSEGKLNMTEITFMLGFSELSSFSRAYKRWTGHSPRNELMAPAP